MRLTCMCSKNKFKKIENNKKNLFLIKLKVKKAKTL